MRRTLCVASLLLITGIAAAAPASDKQLIDFATAKVMERLKDPGSANFRKVRVTRKSGGTGVCGEVNAKNSFNGFAGYMPFMVAGTKVVFPSDMPSGQFEGVWNQIC